MGTNTEAKDTRRRAIWCDGDVVDTAKRTAQLKGMSVRQYMRELLTTMEQQQAAVVAELASLPTPSPSK